MTNRKNDNLQSGLLAKLLALFFQLLYHQFAWTYDFVSWVVSWGQWRNWIMTLLSKLGEGNILELGFGPGHFQVSAAKSGNKIFGLDLSPQMVSMAKKRILKSGKQPYLSLGDGQRLPYADQSFTQVVATFPTEYVFVQDTLREIHRVLLPHGEFLLLPMAWITGKRWIYRFLSWLFQVTGQNVERNDSKLGEFKSHFEDAGFTINWEIISFENSEVLLISAWKHKKPLN
jgi:ubiquinone/menaquinone biosynthesis C-methylase UbiE